MRICSGISTKWLFIHRFQIELEFKSVDFCAGRKTGEPTENSRSKDENQQQTQPTYDARSRNQTRATLVECKHSHQCTIPAPKRICYSYLITALNNEPMAKR